MRQAMNPVELDVLIDQILSRTDRDQPGEAARVRAELADRLNGARSPTSARRISAAEIVALADDALDPADRDRLEADLVRSPDMLLDVVDTLDFLNDIEAR